MDQICLIKKTWFEFATWEYGRINWNVTSARFVSLLWWGRVTKYIIQWQVYHSVVDSFLSLHLSQARRGGWCAGIHLLKSIIYSPVICYYISALKALLVEAYYSVSDTPYRLQLQGRLNFKLQQKQTASLSKYEYKKSEKTTLQIVWHKSVTAGYFCNTRVHNILFGDQIQRLFTSRKRKRKRPQARIVAVGRVELLPIIVLPNENKYCYNMIQSTS